MRAQAQGESPCKGMRTDRNGGKVSSSSAGVVVSAGVPQCVQQHEYCLRAGQHAEVNPRRTGKMSEKQPSVEGTECQGLVVDLSLALRVATMDKHDWEALCQTRGVQLPAAIARVSKSQLITRLLSQASWDVLLPAFGCGHMCSCLLLAAATVKRKGCTQLYILRLKSSYSSCVTIHTILICSQQCAYPGHVWCLVRGRKCSASPGFTPYLIATNSLVQHFCGNWRGPRTGFFSQ